MGSSTETSAYGPTRNPLIQRACGRLVGRLGRPVAAEMTPLALARTPVVRFANRRRSAAWWSEADLRFGVALRTHRFFEFARSDGPLATNAADAALLLEVIAGHDPMDSTSLPSRRRYCSRTLTTGSRANASA